MRMTKLAALALIIASLAGCGPTPQEANQMTQTNLKTPQTIGKLPDGRDLKLVIVVPANSAYPHYVYYVGGSVTNNHLIPAGKTTRLDVQALIPADATVDEVIAKAKELEAQQTLQDESEYNRLKQKLGK